MSRYPAWKDAKPKDPPWAICRTGTVAEIVAEARALESLASDDLRPDLDATQRSLARWSECCWVWAVMALLEDRPLSRRG